MIVSLRWVNSYGSTMDLWQFPDGRLFGLYGSSTGSSGTYVVVGRTAGPAPTATEGQAVALSIFWRSVTGGTGDPSWHWVSGLGGQQFAASTTAATMPLIHAMVATTDFPELSTPPGVYLDKLVYQAVGAPPARPLIAELAGLERGRGGPADPIDGTWRCRERHGLSLTLGTVSAQYGVVDGLFSEPGRESRLLGVTDSYAAADGIRLQGLSLSVAHPEGRTQALAGSLDFADGVLTLTALDSRGTPASQSYVQTSTASLSFVKAKG